jgi:predicted RNA binding protein YcfA (HicA-like mRNA interferase family)
MPKIAGVSADEAVRALRKAGFVVLRQGKHIVMSNGLVQLTIPRHDPVNAYTMGAIAADAVDMIVWEKRLSTERLG